MSKNSTREITTSMIGKEDLFKSLAVANAIGAPILLVGDPGVGKTKAVLEYAASMYKKEDGTPDHEKIMEKTFILETDEGTRSAEVKGRVNIKKLIQDETFEMLSPIVDSEFVVINEVDKASAAVRNSLLGVMNEKILFNGQEKVDCKWKVFVATCNEIPKDEEGNPFWDRFLIKIRVNRVLREQLEKYYADGERKYEKVVMFSYPETQMDLDKVRLNDESVKKFLHEFYTNLSDRTLTFVPTLARAISAVYGMTSNQALVKTATWLIGEKEAGNFGKRIVNPVVNQIISDIDMMRGMTNSVIMNESIRNINEAVAKGKADGHITSSDMDEIIHSVNSPIHGKHPKAAEFKFMSVGADFSGAENAVLEEAEESIGESDWFN